jgi:hypothetical protein
MQKQAEAPHPDRIQLALTLLFKEWLPAIESEAAEPRPQTPAPAA